MAILFNIQNASGLTEICAAERLQEEGYNELPSSRQRSVLAIALEVVREPMFLLLVACGVLYMLTGELTDALMLLGFVFVVMGITIFQERRTERALEALKKSDSPEHVRRYERRRQDRSVEGAFPRGDNGRVRCSAGEPRPDAVRQRPPYFPGTQDARPWYGEGPANRYKNRKGGGKVVNRAIGLADIEGEIEKLVR